MTELSPTAYSQVELAQLLMTDSQRFAPYALPKTAAQPVLHRPRFSRCGHPTTWTVLQKDGSDHLGLWCNVLPAHQMAPITSSCVPFSDLTLRTLGLQPLKPVSAS